MSDLSTREQIRADAIARVAESLAAGEGRADLIVSRHWCIAEAAVDALGDLLPTGVEQCEALVTRAPVRKYTHDWIEVSE